MDTNSNQDNKRVEEILDHYHLLKKRNDFKRVNLAFSMSEYESNLLAALADKYQVNKSEFVRVCLHYFATSINYKKY